MCSRACYYNLIEVYRGRHKAEQNVLFIPIYFYGTDVITRVTGPERVCTFGYFFKNEFTLVVGGNSDACPD